MPTPTKESITEALGKVVDPTFDKPMLDIGTLSDIEVVDGKVSLTAQLSSPADAIRELARTRIREALEAAGVTDADVNWKIQVPTREVMGDDPLPGVRNVVLVMSGKGGVGKSTVATNLAVALKRMGMRVGLLDADMYGPSIPTMLGVRGAPHSTDGKKIQPLQRFGIGLMSMGFLVEDAKQAIVWRGPMLHGALRQFVIDVDWGELDFLVLDLPPGTGDVALTLSQLFKVTGVLMVTTPQEVALEDVYKGVDMCKKLQLPILGVVENMSFFVDSAGVKHELFGAGGGEKIAEFAEAPLLGQVPIDPQVRVWGDEGTPIVQAAPGSEPAKTFMNIADKLTTRIAVEQFERGGGKSVPGDGPKRLRIVR
ncbi:MAG: Mrp/NBP35 family ATP-binding protein [Myxococcales bacterium]|nr:Mrp/NBP35 family ATP-binding protein [Myxococcales bacterium]